MGKAERGRQCGNRNKNNPQEPRRVELIQAECKESTAQMTIDLGVEQGGVLQAGKHKEEQFRLGETAHMQRYPDAQKRIRMSRWLNSRVEAEAEA